MKSSLIGAKWGTLINYATCVVLLPFVIMMYQYQRNIQYLSLWQVLIFCIVVSILLLALYFIVNVISRSNLGAFLFTSILFFSFFMYRTLLAWFIKANLSSFTENQISVLTMVAQFLMYVSIAAILSYKIVKTPKPKFINKLVIKLFPLKSSIAVSDTKLFFKTKLPLCGVIVCIVLSILIRQIYNGYITLFEIKQQGRLFFSCVVIFAMILTSICCKFREKLKIKAITTAVFVMICAILIQNVAIIVLFASKQQTSNMFYKENFNVTLPLEGQPNIYWVHCDGMLGFDAMSRFFGDEQEVFTQELESRGFWINREASFEAARATDAAIPTLMSPYYYDRVLSWNFDPEYAKSIPQNEELINNPNRRLEANITSIRIAREKNETVMAFNAAGYNTSTIYHIDIYFYPTVNQFYDFGFLLTPKRSTTANMSFVNSIANLRNLFDLLDKISPLPSSMSINGFGMRNRFAKMMEAGFTRTRVENKIDLFSEWEIDDPRRENIGMYSNVANSLYDTFDLSGPRFTLYSFDMLHYPFYFDEFGNYIAEDANNPMRYPAHHTFSANKLLKFVDMTLEHDPDAVIVLQADHGLHGIANLIGVEGVMDIFSCTSEEAAALWNSTMSAVRLPKGMMNQESEKILSDPRNISRYLINNFIGENYDYIPYQHKQRFVGPDLHSRSGGNE